MGFSISWLALKRATADEAAGALGLVRTGREADFAETDFCGAMLPTGWYLIVGNGTAGYQALMESDLAAHSATYDLVVCEVYEGPMYSSAAFWSGGARVWQVAHDPKRGRNDLDATGDLPESFEAMRLQFAERQKNEGGGVMPVDLTFNVPLELAHQLTGFYHSRRKAREAPRVWEELRIRDAG